MHILNMEQSLKWFSDSTVGVPDTEHDLKTNDTAGFRKRSANEYKGLNIVFIIILPLNIPFKMDQNNLNNSAINLNTKYNKNRQNTKYTKFFLSQNCLPMLLNKTTFWGMGIFFAF